MQWIEVSLRVRREQSDIVAGLLAEYGYQGVVIEQEDILPDRWDEDEVPPADYHAVRAYLPLNDEAETVKQNLETALLAYELAPVYATVDEENWAEAWKAHYHPTRIGQHIVVRPIWEKTEIREGDIEIALDPGMAFGTGTHATTRLCLEVLEDVMRPGLSVLDLGCGSGILAIAAAKLGAAKVIALDIDPISVRATEFNAWQNNVTDKISAYQGSLDTILHSARRFDLLLANILAKTIIAMCDDGLGQVVRPGGKAILSGIILGQVDDVKAALVNAGLTSTQVRVEGDWVAIEAHREGTLDD